MALSPFKTVRVLFRGHITWNYNYEQMLYLSAVLKGVKKCRTQKCPLYKVRYTVSNGSTGFRSHLRGQTAVSRVTYISGG